MDARREFVSYAREPGANISALCAQFMISRKTGYKWLKRSKRGSSFDDASRKPMRSPLRVAGSVVAEVVQVRNAHPFWGAKKIAAIVRGRGKGPSARTVSRILERCGLQQPLRRRPRKQKLEKPAKLPIPKKPNDLWTVDFKGWWLAKSGERCEPLTVRDAHSRFVLALEVFGGIDGKEVRAVFEQLFSRFGLPKSIQTDNGPPFVSANSWHGLSELSVWWLSLGINHVRSRPGKPSDNGGHERMHRDIANEVERFAAMTRELQAKACERWRHDYNHHRPHEALAMKTPASVYKRSAVEYQGSAAEPAFPANVVMRRVGKTGWIKHQQITVFLTRTLAGRRIGLEPTTAPRQYYVWFGHKRLGRIDFKEERPRFQKAA